MKHNTYKDNKFQNIEFTDSNSHKSIGVIEPGSYNFTTEYEEDVKCLTGQITINGNRLNPGENIIINKNKNFTISVEETSSYLCIYK